MLNFGGVSLLFSAGFCKHISTVYITIWHGFGYRFLWVPLSLWFGAIRHFGLSLRDYLHERKFWRNLICIIVVHPAIITWEPTIETEQRKSSSLLSHLVLLWYFLGPPQILHAVLCQTILLPQMRAPRCRVQPASWAMPELHRWSIPWYLVLTFRAVKNPAEKNLQK